MITVILKFWREALIAILLISCYGMYEANSTKTQKIEILNSTNKTLSDSLKDTADQLTIFKQAAIKSDKNRIEAEKKRAEIIAKMTEEINTLRLQTPPKECSVAVEWAIDNKSDLSWKK